MISAHDQHENCTHRPLLRVRAAGEPLPDAHDIGAQSIERRLVRVSPGADRNVDRRVGPKAGQKVESDELAKAPLQAIAIHRRVPMPRHDDANARLYKLGRGGIREHADVEVSGPDPLPFSTDRFEISSPRQAIRARKDESAVTRQRTCSEA